MKNCFDIMLEDYKKRGAFLSQEEFCEMYNYKKTSYYVAKKKVINWIQTHQEEEAQVESAPASNEPEQTLDTEVVEEPKPAQVSMETQLELLKMSVPFEHNNNYLITPTGQVYSKNYGRFLLTQTSYEGYKYVMIGRNKYYIHRLVAEKFVPNPNPVDFPIVDHIDKNRANNFFTNLRWISTSENNKGRRPNNPNYKRRLRGFDMINEEYREFENVKDAALYLLKQERCSSQPAQIRKRIIGVLDYLNGNAYGWHWEYADAETNSN